MIKLRTKTQLNIESCDSSGVELYFEISGEHLEVAVNLDGKLAFISAADAHTLKDFLNETL